MFDLDEDTTYAWLDEALRALCTRTGYTLAWYHMPVPDLHMPRPLTSSPCTTTVPISFSLASDLCREDEGHQLQKQQALEAQHEEMALTLQWQEAEQRVIDMAEGHNFLSVLRVLGAFRQMGATTQQLEREMVRFGWQMMTRIHVVCRHQLVGH